MENKEKKSNGILIGICVLICILIVVILYAVSKFPSKEVVSQPSNVISQPTQNQPVVSSTTMSKKWINYTPAGTDENACSKQAEVVNNRYIAQSKANGWSTAGMSYQAHYNDVQKECFILGKDTSYDSYAEITILSETLADAYNNSATSAIASYSNTITKTNPPKISSESCMISGVNNCTYAQFTTFVNTEMENTAR